MLFQDIKFDFEDLSEEELEEILDYSDSDKTFNDRYTLACQVLANMIKNSNPDELCNIEVVDLAICKLLIDGNVKISNESHSIH